jgi:MFS family permease
MEESRR